MEKMDQSSCEKESRSTFDMNLFLKKINADVSVASMLENIPEPEQHDPDCEELLLHQTVNDVKDELRSAATEKFDKNKSYDGNLHSVFSNKYSVGETQTQAYQDKGTQVKSGDLFVNFCSFIKTDEELMTMCNINSFAILNELVKIMDKYYPRKIKCTLSTRDCIILTCAKLKLDVSFSALAILFHENGAGTIRNVFYDTVQKLSTILQSIITRVSKEEIQRNMPKCFKKYQSTTSVLDCTEIRIQQPKCLKCCIQFYSHYKGDLTIKFMTETTPGGVIVAVSEAFDGQASDKTIFNQINTLQYLESTRDAIMISKGFLIEDECAAKRIKLFRPPFLENKSQLPQEDSTENSDITCARVYIEKLNQRIKLLEILNHKLPWHFVNYIEDIFIICCGLSNLAPPILADDEFE